ncbi:PREDICTED: geranylgeranyl transferase type-2 subunit alpha isoform X2 [Acromyrmex echinatior]|uniref:geranylgeranyl transferase type-2 subunit alpha isoform X2 n=1 Tax=Acromyrmex echinatior TaxID=103372 RepID=UPI000580CBD8|nr:PREDICTED: geranylgeranyl transferase type-2 subunit alpha isoform X2 [Acromyrmex echinatior]
MHGRVKVRTTAEQEEIKKRERAIRVVQYKTDIATVFQKRKDKKWDDELLSVTKRMLLNNSDIYTLWNIRREFFENNEWNEEDYKQLLENEMSLTEQCLRDNPKSYSVWHQRCWVMERMSEPDWKKELSLCAKCLNIDERNFHCWDYREFVVQKAGISNEEEFEFSTTKILNNFSNYSSWHYRSRILTKMFGTTSEEIPIVDDKYREDEKFAKLRIAEFARSLEDLNSAKEVTIKLQDTIYQLLYSELEGAWIYKDNSSLHKQNSNDKQLNKQLKSYNQLSEMEPNNKWALLTSTLLMKKIDFNKFYNDILNNLSALSKIDSLRKNYYKDLRSKLLVEYKLLEMWKEENDLEIQSKIDLSGLDLTKLHNNHYFSFFKEVNLGANQLENSLYQLSTLQRCAKLSLSSNGLTSLKRFPTLYNLEVLSLRNNKLVSMKEIVNLIKRHKNLRRLDLRNNPVCQESDIAKIQDTSSHVEICLQ